MLSLCKERVITAHYECLCTQPEGKEQSDTNYSKTKTAKKHLESEQPMQRRGVEHGDGAEFKLNTNTGFEELNINKQQNTS
jgi:hypothetical protein